MQYDVIIIGGSYAGLAAGLQLARARRRVLVVDTGVRRNRFASASHGFFGHDGVPPADLAALGREQLLAYPTVEWHEGEARRVEPVEGGYAVCLGDTSARASRIILATGIRDVLPDIPGLEERWGRHVFHCPYCHGYELGGGPVGVLASSAMAVHQAMMLPDWGPTTLFSDGLFRPGAEELAGLERRGVKLEHVPVARIEGEGVNILLADDRTVSLAGLFVQPRMEMTSGIAHQMGLAFEEGPLGAFVQTDAMKQTSRPGVFACGDMARPAGSVGFAVADGTMAGLAAHRSLIFGL
ncbi:NAD(P)/FAD-dependent oxidoreductase [Glycocaulis sp.]|uniref:NAD(P)/FAD-dependent oxidoreductase n=1 Tax=Glycocaulis sp. TaxID=1969725 RepID=UPI003F6F9AC7